MLLLEHSLLKNEFIYSKITSLLLIMTKGFLCGVFDLFHYGHILALRECKQHCNHLTVAVNRAEHLDYSINPGKKQPIFPIEQRVALLKECRLVDEVLVYNSEDELRQILTENSFDVRFLGDDYREKKNNWPRVNTYVAFSRS